MENTKTAPPKTSDKTKAQSRPASSGLSFTYGKVLRLIQDPETRSRLASLVKEAKIPRDAIETSSFHAGKFIDLLTRIEDEMELKSMGTKKREQLREVRRALELDLWP
jgi:hypothetical protein